MFHNRTVSLGVSFDRPNSAVGSIQRLDFENEEQEKRVAQQGLDKVWKKSDKRFYKVKEYKSKEKLIDNKVVKEFLLKHSAKNMLSLKEQRVDEQEKQEEENFKSYINDKLERQQAGFKQLVETQWRPGVDFIKINRKVQRSLEFHSDFSKAGSSRNFKCMKAKAQKANHPEWMDQWCLSTQTQKDSEQVKKVVLNKNFSLGQEQSSQDIKKKEEIVQKLNQENLNTITSQQGLKHTRNLKINNIISQISSINTSRLLTPQIPKSSFKNLRINSQNISHNISEVVYAQQQLIGTENKMQAKYRKGNSMILKNFSQQLEKSHTTNNNFSQNKHSYKNSFSVPQNQTNLQLFSKQNSIIASQEIFVLSGAPKTTTNYTSNINSPKNNFDKKKPEFQVKGIETIQNFEQCFTQDQEEINQNIVDISPQTMISAKLNRKLEGEQLKWKRKIDLLTYDKALKRINNIQREQEKVFWDSNFSFKLRIKHLMNIFKNIVKFIKMHRKIVIGFQNSSLPLPKFKIVPLQSPLSFQFLESVKFNNIPLVIDLLKNNPELVYECDMTYMSALHMACRKNLDHMFDVLMRYYPYLDFKDSSGRTPLLYCIINKNFNMCKKLLYNGASPWTEFDHVLYKVKLDQNFYNLINVAKSIYISMKLNKRSEQYDYFGKCRILIQNTQYK